MNLEQLNYILIDEMLEVCQHTLIAIHNNPHYKVELLLNLNNYLSIKLRLVKPILPETVDNSRRYGYGEYYYDRVDLINTRLAFNANQAINTLLPGRQYLMVQGKQPNAFTFACWESTRGVYIKVFEEELSYEVQVCVSCLSYYRFLLDWQAEKTASKQ